MAYCIYLRKSRADAELERTMGEGETLARHRKTLLQYANEKKLGVVKIYEEVFSGESLIHRPQMMQLLQDVEAKMYTGVIVMDKDRLGRGSMKEQGIIIETFKESGTLIVTPGKTYDLNDEFDEDYSEFESFMAHKEYKMIKKRLQRGVIRSVRDGKYMAPQPPFGYRIRNEKYNRTLDPDPEQAVIVRMIFDMYVTQGAGSQIIADRLNDLGIKTIRGNRWTHNAVLYILKNPIYIGKVTWSKVKVLKSSTPGRMKKTKARSQSEWIVSPGRHQSIVDEDIFEQAQKMLKNSYKSPVKADIGLVNPLAGIVVCKTCGSKMIYRTYSNGVEPHIMCRSKCGNKSSKFKHVEARILADLLEWIDRFDMKTAKKIAMKENAVIKALQTNQTALENELRELHVQKSNLHDLLERNVYDIDTFIERSRTLTARIEETERAIVVNAESTDKELSKVSKEPDVVNRIKNLLDLYPQSQTAAERNAILKSVLEKVEYKKRRDQREDDFQIWLYPWF